MTRLFLWFALLIAVIQPVQAQDLNPYREDALALPGIINEQYAYLDRLTGGVYQLTPRLQAEAEAVIDQKSLLAFAERALFLLADHHAITGGSFKDSWGLVPSYSDLWIEAEGTDYRVTAVRGQSAAEKAGIQKGAVVKYIGGMSPEARANYFWEDLGHLGYSDAQAGYALRIYAAGRRDRDRNIVVINPDGEQLSAKLPSRYTLPQESTPLTVMTEGKVTQIIFNDSLGNSDTIAAFDEAMAKIGSKQALILDLRNTVSGGNTSVARAIMGWFVTKPTSYQIHRSPVEERQTGIARQWIEQVLPRVGKYRKGPVTVLVGRWTGSMGEGLAVGMKAIGAKIKGDPMAHLLGAIEDIRLPNTGFVFKIPTERLYAVDGTPREKFIPEPISGKKAGNK